jgi:hypothetical protein
MTAKGLDRSPYCIRCGTRYAVTDEDRCASCQLLVDAIRASIFERLVHGVRDRPFTTLIA